MILKGFLWDLHLRDPKSQRKGMGIEPQKQELIDEVV